MKRVLILMLVLALGLSLCAPVSAAGLHYSDVTPEDWYADGVAFVTYMNLMNPVEEGRFGVGETISVNECFDTIWAAADLFHDSVLVGEDTISFWKPLVEAVFAGERGEEPVYRIEFAQLLYTVLGNFAETSRVNPFHDFDYWILKKYTFAAPSVTWLYEKGISNGTAPGIFSPLEPITREQAAEMLWRCWVLHCWK